MSRSLKHQFLAFIKEHQLLSRGDRVLLAVSGGVDSMVLWHLLRSWQRYFRLELGIAHLDHGYRGAASQADARWVARQALDRQLPFYTRQVDMAAHAAVHNLSIEEAGRQLRYAFLNEIAQTHEYRCIATAHHHDDQVETLLMRLLTGTGLHGLAGIRLRREQYIRPLLFASRENIEAYAAAEGVSFREDGSNEELRFLRNRIRHRLLPFLRSEFDVGRLQSFQQVSMGIQELLPAWEKTVEDAVKSAFDHQSENKIRLDIGTLKGYFSGIRLKLVAAIATRIAERPQALNENSFRSLMRWLNASSAARSFRLSPDVRLRKEGSWLVFYNVRDEVAALDYHYRISAGETIAIDELGVEVSVSVAQAGTVVPGDGPDEYVDGAQIQFPLTLRRWQPGDRFQPLGMTSSQKVSDFLTHHKNLIVARHNMPVLINEDEILWIPGTRISERYKLSESSKTIYQLNVKVR